MAMKAISGTRRVTSSVTQGTLPRKPKLVLASYLALTDCSLLTSSRPPDKRKQLKAK